MFLLHFMYLFIAWMFILASEHIFPKVHPSLSFTNEWSTLLFFRPFHLLVSFLCFLAGFLIIRHLTNKHIRLLFEKGKIIKWNRVENLAMVGLGWFLVVMIVSKHFTPTLVVVGVFMAYDVLTAFLANRRKKRLETALRELRR